MQMYNPAHPGRVLREFMGDKITVSSLAKHLGVTRTNLSLIVNEKAGISALMGLKLDEAFGTSEGLWLRLQLQYDLAQARKKKRAKVPLLKLAA
jgi:addiction module HigA family antidote